MNRPLAAWASGLLVVGLLAGLPAAATADEASTVTVEGELSVAIEDTADGTETVHVAIDTGDVLIPVDLDLPDGTRSGAPVTAELVDGSALDAALAGTATSDVEVADVTALGAATVTAAVPSAHRAYIAISSAGSEPSNSAVESAVDAMAAWWVNEADGAITGFTRPLATRTFDSGCSIGASDSTVLAAKAAFNEIDFGDGKGNHLIIVGANCGGVGLGQLGNALDDGGWTIATWDTSTIAATLIHEVGHNVGLVHAGLANCVACGSAEYGNLYHPMGLVVAGLPFAVPALDSSFRSQLGIEQEGEVSRFTRTGTGDATAVLQGRSGETGLRGLRVEAGDGSTYWIDYRDGADRDEGAFYDTPYQVTYDPPGPPVESVPWAVQFDPGVTVVREDVGEFRLMPTASAGARITGQTFSDSQVTVDVIAISGGTATVKIHDVVEDVPPPPDTTPPVVSWTNPAADVVKGVSQPFAFSITDASPIASRGCSRDGGPFLPCTAATSHTVATSGLPVGEHNLRARATDVSGNVGTTPFHTFWVLFSDVPRDHLFFGDIRWLLQEGVTQGYPDGTYIPSNTVNRGSMAAFLYRAAGEPPFTAPLVPRFPDVPTTHTFYKEIEWLASTGITEGYADGAYRPANTVTRGSMAAFLYRLSVELGGQAFETLSTASYPDVPVGHLFHTEVEWLKGEGITQGYPDGTYGPTNPVNRGSMAAFLHRFLD